jgi:hypothetical protein
MVVAHSERGRVEVVSLRKRMVAARSEAEVEAVVCSRADNEAVACSRARIKDGRWWR